MAGSTEKILTCSLGLDEEPTARSKPAGLDSAAAGGQDPVEDRRDENEEHG
jgi:hypothetical protein